MLNRYYPFQSPIRGPGAIWDTIHISIRMTWCGLSWCSAATLCICSKRTHTSLKQQRTVEIPFLHSHSLYLLKKDSCQLQAIENTQPLLIRMTSLWSFLMLNSHFLYLLKEDLHQLKARENKALTHHIDFTKCFLMLSSNSLYLL